MILQAELIFRAMPTERLEKELQIREQLIDANTGTKKQLAFYRRKQSDESLKEWHGCPWMIPIWQEGISLISTILAERSLKSIEKSSNP